MGVRCYDRGKFCDSAGYFKSTMLRLYSKGFVNGLVFDGMNFAISYQITFMAWKIFDLESLA